MSEHIRVRSISLRSIRGIYFRKGARTWRVERVSYAWSSVQGARRFAVKIDGVRLQVAKEEEREVKKTSRRHTRNLTLADLNPSPLARHAWQFISTLTLHLEPYFRPLIRTYVIACLRIGIQWLPKITQAISFNLHSMTITFDEVPGAKVVVEEIGLHTALALTYLEPVDDIIKAEESRDRRDSRSVQGMNMWKKRLAESLQRSFDKALGDSRGTATLSLHISNVIGTMPRDLTAESFNVPFLLSPGTIELGISVRFNPKEGAIDPHGLEVSLKIDDCSAKADLVQILLSKVIPKKSRTTPFIDLSVPSSPSYGNNFLSSSTSLHSQLSPGPPSTAMSFTSSLFSPTSVFSPSELKSPKPSLFSPNSAKFLSPRSPKSPSSPFFQAISASMRPRRRHLTVPSAKLSAHKDQSLILALHSIRVSIASATLSILSEIETGSYIAVFKDIDADLSLSDPSVNHLHREHLGGRQKSDNNDSDVYALKLGLRQVTIERESNHHTMRLARLGTIDFQALASSWPHPFLMPTPFLRNEPNASFLGVYLRITDIHATDRIYDIQQIINTIQTLERKGADSRLSPTSSSSALPSYSIPRLFVTLECGPILGRVIYDADKGEKHRAVELRSNGFSVLLQSEYKHPSRAIGRFLPAASSVQSLHFKSTLSINLEPILVRVRSTQTFIGTDEPSLRVSDDAFLDDPPILSIGSIEVFATANAIAQIDGAANSVAIVDKSTLIFDLSVALETVCIELWHPISVDAALRLISLLPRQIPKSHRSGQSVTPRLLGLPTGLTARLAVARFVVFITAPDISPNDNTELSRGFSLRTTISLDYCSLRPNQDHWFNNAQRSQNRAKLSLPVETLADALIAAKSFGLSSSKSGFIKARLFNIIFAAAVATQYEPDEPAIVGREDISDSSKKVLQIDDAQMDICLSCKESTNPSKFTDSCEASAQIPLVRVFFQLAHAYSILLGLQTISILNHPRPPSPPVTTEVNKADMVISFHANITALQALVTLPSQKLVLRVDGLSSHLKSGGFPRIKCTKAVVFVALPACNNRWEEPCGGAWGEFITLQGWEISLTSLAESLCVSVDGESGRLRIPDGFVLADLIQDASVSAKAIKHMAFMATMGCYSQMPNPTPEGPKSVPHLTIRLGTFCFEAQDDPFETKLGLIWQAGAEAVKQRMDREEAFKAKVAAVLSAEPELLSNANLEQPDAEYDYQFSARHTVSIQEARKRLDDVHALDWILRLEKEREKRSKDESSMIHKLYGTLIPTSSNELLEIMTLPKSSSDPPLARGIMRNLCLTISPPSFSIDRIADVMYDLGSGLPRDTQFSLLVPLHIHFTVSSFKVTLRDYPLPLLHIPARSDPAATSWTFDTDIIIGEEMGTQSSVDWVRCPVIGLHQASHGEAPLSILVPKTIMPVKTYAAPIIKVATTEPTVFSWGVSYGPAIQDLMRVVETLSSLPRDSSPAVGFWDKMKLVFHWTVKVSFSGDVRLYMKGSRDPYKTVDIGTGFVLCWQGSPEIRVGYENPQKELIQVTSEGMLIAVPNLSSFTYKGRPSSGQDSSQSMKPFQKVCARLSSGVRYGIGFVLERSCGPECLFCTGSAFERKCRYFTFRPHYEVKLEIKSSPPKHPKDPDDSYNGFRSDFIHLSLSLACFTNRKAKLEASSLYLTPKSFAHFWSWSSLFDGALTLPIRQGNYHPSRPISPKLGRHLATLKYRISLPNLYFMHGYIDDARETWVDGVTPWVGLKGKVDELLVDMHQREEESIVPGLSSDTTRVMRRKPFYAAEVIMKGLELRAMLATFSEPLKQDVQMTAPSQRSNYRKHSDLPITPSTSIWHDLDDFIELDWSHSDPPTLHLLPLANCPHFTYFKRNEMTSSGDKSSKFGSEHSHICLLGKEPSVPKTQINLATIRATELKRVMSKDATSRTVNSSTKAMSKMVTLLEDYIAVLKEVEIKPGAATQEPSPQSYHMPSDIVSSDEWTEFDNVYQIHCPSIFMGSAVRDIMIQYYYCSRDRRGFEYHMSTRAVKFIRDQAKAALADETEEDNTKERSPNTAQMAASAIRKILKGETSAKIPTDVIRESNAEVSSEADPLDGWTEGVSLRKSHFCLLLKPQIILRGEGPGDKCIVAAAQAKLQSFAIMDLLNLDDPISGKVMSRNYTSLSGLQTFAPTDALSISNGCVPLEVLIDLRCESDAFERLVPQTEAIFHYDKFNRLRLRNNTTSIITKASTTPGATTIGDSHLQDQTDLIRVHIPRFTVSANTEHFEAISNIVTKLLLVSDPAHKTRLDKLETLIFKYDFTDLGSASQVISSLQDRLRDAVETERLTMRNWKRLEEEGGRFDLLQLKQHIFLMSEELNLLFDSIKMAQDRFDDHTDQKSALLLHASSTEISWRMLDARQNLLSKLVVANISFHWLSRQDSSTVNNLAIGNLSAFDGSRYALWTEILSKYDEPPNHPLLKRGLFLLANWTILAPVGGITIYEAFELSLHPLRLQIDAKVGRRIMEYIWPKREERHAINNDTTEKEAILPEIMVKSPTSATRSSIDSPRGLHTAQRSVDLGTTNPSPKPLLRKLGSSRSFTDLKSAREDSLISTPTFLKPQGLLSPPAFLKRTHSSDSINFSSMLEGSSTADAEHVDAPDKKHDIGDAHVMKTRSSQKTFVLVRISSLDLLLSVVKEGSFECHEAKIKTRELEYRNQTWSFEELVHQFIPSNMSWRGWVKMAFHQPLVPVLPVARELFSKTKWTASSKPQPQYSALRLLHPGILATDDDQRLTLVHAESSRKVTEMAARSSWRNPLRSRELPHLTSLPLTAEPESMDSLERPNSPERSTSGTSTGRKRVKSLFSKGSRQSSKSRGQADKLRQSEDVSQKGVEN